jgi:uncharacterized protein
MLSHSTIPFSYNMMAKPSGSLCNLHCDYCYYCDKQTAGQNGELVMKDEILEKFIKQYIQSQTSPVVVFNWQGGEALLAGQVFYEKALALQQKYAGKKRIENTMQTNGTLIDESWCSFFRENEFLVGVSVDGPREIHDFHRSDSMDNGSWERTMKGISLLRDYGIPFNTLTAVTSHSMMYPLEIYSFLKGLGSDFQQYSPVVERFSPGGGNVADSLAPPEAKGDLEITPWSVTPERYGTFLNTIFDEWVRNDVGEVFVQHFEAALANWLGEDPGLCLFRSTCGTALMIERNGDVYSCDHYAFPSYIRGNILESSLKSLVHSESQQKFGLSKFTRLPEYCRSCEYLFACYGECPRNRFETTAEGVEGLNYLCPGLKKYFSHIAPFMDYMAEQIKLDKNPASIREIASGLLN